MSLFISNHLNLKIFLGSGAIVVFKDGKYWSQQEGTLPAEEVELRLLAHPNCGKENHFKPVDRKSVIDIKPVHIAKAVNINFNFPKYKTGKKLKILLSGRSMTYLSGQQVYYYETAMEMARQGHEVWIVSEWEHGLEDEGKQVMRGNLEKSGVHRLNFFDDMDNLSFDIIYVSEPCSEPIVAKFKNTPVVNLIHSQYDCETPITGYANIIKYVCNRQEVIDHLFKEHGIPRKMCCTVYNGVDMTRFKRSAKEKTRKYHKVVIPGTIDPLRKNLLIHFIEKADKNYRVFIVGMKLDLFNQLPKKDYVYFIPPQFHIEDIIKDADEVVGIHFGRTNIEAMACGVKTSWYDPETLEKSEVPEFIIGCPKGQEIRNKEREEWFINYRFNIKNTVKRLLSFILKPDVTFIIPHHDRHDHLANLLDNFESFHYRYPMRIILGGSFGDNCNTGAKGVDTEWLCLLNDDVTFPDELALTNMTLTDGDIVGCSMEPSVNGFLFDKEGKWTPCSACYTEGPLSQPAYPSGAVLFIKTKVWEVLEGFDPAYITGCEDTDLFLRAEEKGYRIRIIPDKVNHLELQSEGRLDYCNENIETFNRIWGPKYRYEIYK